MTDKISKIVTQLGQEIISELDAMDELNIKTRITQAHQAIRDTKVELEKNTHYRHAKQVISDLSRGYRDVKKRQDAISEYCLFLLDEKGVGSGN